MIIKIERHGRVKDEWYLLDKVSEIRRYNRNLNNRSKHFWTDNGEEQGANFIISDHINVESKASHYVEIHCERENGESFVIYFDTIAYIQNDTGKTIEKILVNHRYPEGYFDKRDIYNNVVADNNDNDNNDDDDDDDDNKYKCCHKCKFDEVDEEYCESCEEGSKFKMDDMYKYCTGCNYEQNMLNEEDDDMCTVCKKGSERKPPSEVYVDITKV